MSPLDMYPKMLNFQPKVLSDGARRARRARRAHGAQVSESLTTTLSRNCICPLIVTKGADQLALSSQFSQVASTHARTHTRTHTHHC